MDGRAAPIFFVLEVMAFMNMKSRELARAAIIGALYALLTHGQNLLLPGSASLAVQFRLSEALCILAFFTPAAIPGLSLGCLIFNLTAGPVLPLDFLLGTLATGLAAWGMWSSRRWPGLGLLLPALTNGILVGWELAVYTGGGFWLHALYVAAGEAAVLLTLGSLLYAAMKKRKLHTRLFD